MSILSTKSRESGNAVIIVLVALVVVAVGALAYLSGQFAGEQKTPTDTVAESAMPAAETTGTAETAAAASGEAPAAGQTNESATIKPGNPVVAKVNGQDITRQDIFAFVQTLPPQTRQMPLEQLYPMAVEQVINARVIESKTSGINLDSDAEVKKQMALAKEQITRSVYLQHEVAKRITDDNLKAAYEKYKANFPKIEEIKASHILVKEESKAKDLLEQLKGGADFAELAKANSIDGTAERGGELGYFAQGDVVPAFGDAAFALSAGNMTETPVKTDFGYHIIKAEDKRQRPVPSMEEVKPFLEVQLRRQMLDEMIQDWRKQAKIERFDINGEAIEPAAGQEEPSKPAE